MIVRFKKENPKAIAPTKANEHDAGFDLFAVTRRVGFSDNHVDTVVAAFSSPKFIEYDTGLIFEIPEGYVGLLFPRSSVSNTDLILANCVGVIDSSYRGTIKVRFRGNTDLQNVYNVGDRIAQLIVMPYPKVVLEEVDVLSDTTRGAGGFGSSGLGGMSGFVWKM